MNQSIKDMKSIGDKNRLIAEFMDLELDPNEMKYHMSWDWLMPVGKKCKELLIRPKNGNEVYMLEYLEGMFVSFDINLAFEEVVKVIEWYNENK